VLNYSEEYTSSAEMLIAIVNKTTSEYDPDFYSVNNSISTDEGAFSYKMDYVGHEFEVYMSNFKQNETILNPNEDIHIEATIQNRDFFYDVDVKIEVLLVSYINEEWIISNATSNPQNLKFLGQAGDTKTFSVDLALPSIENDLTWDGINAPIRQGGAKTIIKVYIENNYAGTYKSEDYSLLISEKDINYEGYIVSLKKSITSGKGVILRPFEKDECIYLPENCTFVANIINKDYISIYKSINLTIGLKSPIKFWNITITPEEPIEGKTFTISSNLATEFDIPLVNKEVLCQYYNGDSWRNMTSGLTGSNGFTILKVDTKGKIDASISKSFRLLWMGDNETLNGTQNIDVDIIVQTNSISLSSDDDETFVYTDTVSSIKINLKNSGNSILKILEIDIDIDVSNADYEIKGQDNTVLDRFISGESIEIIIELDVKDVNEDEMDVVIEITAINIITGEILIVSKTIDLDVVHKPLFDYFVENFIYIILSLIALIGISALFYYRSTKKKLEKQAKEVERKRPRRGKYVKVSELKLEPAEIEEKEEELKAIEEKKTVYLDELLEEELETEEKPKEEFKEAPVEKPPEEVELPPKKVKKEPKKKEKPKKGRISTRQMVEQKRKKKKLKKVKKVKKSKPKKALRKKKEDSKKGKTKKTTDLDSLLEGEGLGDKK